MIMFKFKLFSLKLFKTSLNENKKLNFTPRLYDSKATIETVFDNCLTRLGSKLNKLNVSKRGNYYLKLCKKSRHKTFTTFAQFRAHSLKHKYGIAFKKRAKSSLRNKSMRKKSKESIYNIMIQS